MAPSDPEEESDQPLWHSLWHLGGAKRKAPGSDDDERLHVGVVQIDRLTTLEGMKLGDDRWYKKMSRRHDVALRRHQRKVLEAIAAGRDKIVYVAGTGGGKSIAYQLPVYIQPNWMTVVIQLLKALQVQTLDILHAMGIKAAAM